jgi:hypothetical protein
MKERLLRNRSNVASGLPCCCVSSPLVATAAAQCYHHCQPPCNGPTLAVDTSRINLDLQKAALVINAAVAACRTAWQYLLSSLP